MPRTHVRAFRVRYYECDAYGHVNNANYVRYMQEAAFDASAAAGYDMVRYESMGRLWIVHETDVEYLRPLCYGETVEVKTWVADFQRVHSRRRYELRLAGSEDLVARAITDWVFVDSKTFHPAPIPREMIPAFLPDGDGEPPAPRQKAPPPPVAREVFRARRRVQWHDIDSAGWVNNPVYLAYADDAGVQAVAHFGWPVARMRAAGFGIFVRRHHVVYHQPGKLDDEIEVATWATDVKRTNAVRHYLISRVADGALLAEVHTQGVWVDLNSGRPIRAPEQFLADFEPTCAG